MNEYFSKDELVAVLKGIRNTQIMKKGKYDVRAYYADTLAEMIDALPAADVAPVVHGHWVDNCGDKYYVRCFVCANIGYRSFKYCPHCGAKMDKETEEK